MRFATLNISGPSVQRAELLLDYLLGLDADVLVLTETRENEGTRHLLSSLEKDGWSVFTGGDLAHSERGVAVAHRSSGAKSIAVPAHHSTAHRLVGMQVSAHDPICVFGVYVPSRDASASKIQRKQLFLRDMLRVSKNWASKPVVLLGDFNVVSREHEPRFAAFRAWEYDAFEDFESSGMIDAHKHLFPGRQVHSWIGRQGAGYRYDYAFVSQPLAEGIASCNYLHDAREAGLTDHATVVLTLDLTKLRGSNDDSNARNTELVSA